MSTLGRDLGNANFNLGRTSAAEIRAMSYNQLIGLVRETNRLPGGNRSIYLIANRLFMRQATQALEIGCATGATSIELARLTGCAAIGIDINEQSVWEARRRATEVGVKVDFRVADALDVPQPSDSVDVLVCGNVTTLIENKQKAISEYQRLLRTGGYLVAVPMYYVRTPSDAVVNAVRQAIQVDIKIQDRHKAVGIFTELNLEVYDEYDFVFDDISPSKVASFCEQILGRQHLLALSHDAREALIQRYTSFMQLFRENLAYMGFTIVFLRKTGSIEDPELFSARPTALR